MVSVPDIVVKVATGIVPAGITGAPGKPAGTEAVSDQAMPPLDWTVPVPVTEPVVPEPVPVTVQVWPATLAQGTCWAGTVIGVAVGVDVLAGVTCASTLAWPKPK